MRGHELWPTHLEESSFLLIADYTKAQKALLTAAAGAAGTEEKMFTLKFTVAEALGHALAAPRDGMLIGSVKVDDLLSVNGPSRFWVFGRTGGRRG